MAGDFNTGRDITVVITGPNGTVTLSYVTSFDRKQNVTKLKSSCIDGITRHENIPDDWTGSIGLDRAGREVDDLIYALEAGYFAGQKTAKGTITETIQEVDQSISQWRYAPCVFDLSDAGKWAKDSKVEPKLEFSASRRVLVK